MPGKVTTIALVVAAVVGATMLERCTRRPVEPPVAIVERELQAFVERLRQNRTAALTREDFVQRPTYRDAWDRVVYEFVTRAGAPDYTVLVILDPASTQVVDVNSTPERS